jgi:hypothetical protein
MMVRAAFRIEDSGQLLSCLLNPEQLVFRRAAGVRNRRSIGGALAAARATHQPLQFTGGGTTELVLDLLFDVSLHTGPTPLREGVIDLTRPLWTLAESARLNEGAFKPPIVRFFWGTVWNFPAVVVSAAERFENFDSSGSPRRSWLRLRLIQVNEPDVGVARPTMPLEGLPAVRQGEAEEEPPFGDFPLPGDLGPGDEPTTEDDGSTLPGQRLDVLAEAYLGDASRWREIAEANGIDDPLHVDPARVLRIPRGSTGGGAA